MAANRHTVGFYRHDGQFADSAIDWFADGLRAGEACLVIATPAHRAFFEMKSSQGGLLGEGVTSVPGSWRTHDAAATLAQFTGDRWPDPARFDKVVGSMIRAEAGYGSRRVRAFGEIVALLLAGPAPQAAVVLEQLWNRLLDKQRFSLLCSYPRSIFRAGVLDAQLGAICAEHRGVCIA